MANLGGLLLLRKGSETLLRRLIAILYKNFLFVFQDKPQLDNSWEMEKRIHR
jgi:hypothetical protein